MRNGRPNNETKKCGKKRVDDAHRTSCAVRRAAVKNLVSGRQEEQARKPQPGTAAAAPLSARRPERSASRPRRPRTAARRVAHAPRHRQVAFGPESRRSSSASSTLPIPKSAKAPAAESQCSLCRAGRLGCPWSPAGPEAGASRWSSAWTAPAVDPWTEKAALPRATGERGLRHGRAAATPALRRLHAGLRLYLLPATTPRSPSAAGPPPGRRRRCRSGEMLWESASEIPGLSARASETWSWTGPCQGSRSSRETSRPPACPRRYTRRPRWDPASSRGDEASKNRHPPGSSRSGLHASPP